jgi:transposase
MVHGWLQLKPGHLFMQDNTLAHTVTKIISGFENRGIQVIEWPPFSSDLNPMKTVRNWMKDYIEANFP